ncbi:MAG: homoserine kinase [Mesobacillus sp.]|uniref:homoserine kinase n=1 Tax=Mesobacillus sp. TaxID=2675271 RepID=UPI003C4C236A
MNEVEEPTAGGSTTSIKKQVVTVKVPASSANLGPGFDSVGVALSLYLVLQAKRSDSWEITALSSALKDFPRDEQNYISQIAINTARMYKQEMPALKVSIKSDIPLARGLGSSAAAIVAGIELADVFCGLQLSRQEKLRIATKMEGHPDNAGACLFGGFVVGSDVGEEVNLTRLDCIDFDPVLVVPHQELLTEASRDVLPGVVDFKRAVQASAISNQLLAALMTQQWELAGKMMAADMFHQPYRKDLIPFYEEVQEIAVVSGAFGVALSGAGPSLLCLAEPGKGDALAESLQNALSGFEIHRLKVDKEGCQIF